MQTLNMSNCHGQSRPPLDVCNLLASVRCCIVLLFPLLCQETKGSTHNTLLVYTWKSFEVTHVWFFVL